MVTFSNVEAALDDLNRTTPDLFSRSLLIGGWCALLYYRLLAEKNDPEYPAPIPEKAERLQSNDLDFTHVWKGDFSKPFHSLSYNRQGEWLIWKSPE